MSADDERREVAQLLKRPPRLDLGVEGYGYQEQGGGKQAVERA
jgi:hypothetical protein